MPSSEGDTLLPPRAVCRHAGAPRVQCVQRVPACNHDRDVRRDVDCDVDCDVDGNGDDVGDDDLIEIIVSYRTESPRVTGLPWLVRSERRKLKNISHSALFTLKILKLSDQFEY